jgi:FkbM family methyltransferase
MEPYIVTTFKNDGNVSMNVPTNYYYKAFGNNYANIFKNRENDEALFRRLIHYLLENNFIKGNIIDLGAWIGDNSIPWALNHKDGLVYAIDPSPQNIEFINATSALNEIKNLITIESAISDKNENVFTNVDISHATFSTTEGGQTISAASLDYLHTINVISNIGFIHLDVEGFESKVIRGAKKLIQKYKPILAIEQHIFVDDYLSLANEVASFGYSVYLINETLPSCRIDCRNFIAFPFEMDVERIHSALETPLLLRVAPVSNNLSSEPPAATIYGDFMSGRVFKGVRGFKHTRMDLILYPVQDNNYTKIVATDLTGNWVEGRYVIGCVDIGLASNVSNAYDRAQGKEIHKAGYNIRFDS